MYFNKKNKQQVNRKRRITILMQPTITTFIVIKKHIRKILKWHTYGVKFLVGGQEV